MASTALATRLTDAHRASQLRLRVATVRDLLKMWPAFDINDISGTWSLIEPAIVALIQARQPMSAALSGQYIPAFRVAEGVTGNATTVLAPALTADEIVPNLRYVGVKEAWRLHDLKRADAMRTVFTNVEGEVTRQVLNGGRQTIVDTVHADRKAKGYARVTDGSPCAFCAMLAGRGPVYHDEDSGGFEAHRKCGCTAEPVYDLDQPWPESATKYADMYTQAAKAVPKSTPDWSDAVRREFRRLHGADA